MVVRKRQARGLQLQSCGPCLIFLVANSHSFRRFSVALLHILRSMTANSASLLQLLIPREQSGLKGEAESLEWIS